MGFVAYATSPEDIASGVVGDAPAGTVLEEFVLEAVADDVVSDDTS
ncbi:MAG: hypothetical protein H6765_09345 [Candidatus Peribacteria bacterium]|nr:MAG: hypothetical protein H6765_09345 [Candidatus Peribacteria bacterium]